MKVLFLAPQPFFQERGTPIAVRLALQVLAARGQDQIDLLTYHEGSEVPLPGVQQHRICMPRWFRGVGPGISLKKLLCDLVFAIQALTMAWRARHNQYQLVHAVEESVFVAWLIKLLWGVPYIYDMDSSLAIQLTDKWWILRPLRALFSTFERLAVRGSIAVVPVCDALAVVAQGHGARSTHLLEDISLLNVDETDMCVDLRRESGATDDETLILYMGNLEPYQGIDLLLEAFALVEHSAARLVIIGGAPAHVERYQRMAQRLGIQSRVSLLGPRPVHQLNAYLQQAQLLVSPRIKGNNTPMKIYSYLHSGTPIVATDIASHTQVLHPQVAFLAAADAKSYAAALQRALTNPAERQTIGAAARALAEARYTFPVFKRRLEEIYDTIGNELPNAACNTLSA